MALAPLGLWFLFSLLGVPHGNFPLVAAWVADPTHAIMLILLLVTLVYHSSLGLQVVVEDYVRGPAKVITLVLLKFLHVILVVGGIYAILVISMGAGR
jgi:succinate dehydrogenase / fumarate reductase membrane anchor subunit